MDGWSEGKTRNAPSSRPQNLLHHHKCLVELAIFVYIGNNSLENISRMVRNQPFKNKEIQ